MQALRPSFIAALSRIEQQITQQNDAPESPPVKKKKSKVVNRVSVKRKPAARDPDFLPVKFRKTEIPNPSSQTQLLRQEGIAHKHEVKPQPGSYDISVSSTARKMQPVGTDFLPEKPSGSAVLSKTAGPKVNQPPPTIVPENQSDSEIILAKGHTRLPLILAEKIESFEGYVASQKPGRLEQARQLKFKSQVLGNGLYTAKSTIPEAGEGLYAAMNFDAHALITECVGETKPVPTRSKDCKGLWDKIGSNYDSWSHLIEISDHHVLQCIRKPENGRGAGSFANDSWPKKPNSRFIRIMDPMKGRDRVFLKSLQPIKAGAEITVNYGKGFWKSFKEMFPEQYESIFGEELLNIDGLDELLKSDFTAACKHKIVALMNRERAVPNWGELKIYQKEWNEALCIYALYKYHRISADKLTPTVLSLLKADSDHYFRAMGEYACRLKSKANEITTALNKAGSKRPIFTLKAPDNGVFRKDFSRLVIAHTYVLFRFFNQDRYFSEVVNEEGSDHLKLMGLLKKLNPEHPIYEHLLTEYLFRNMKTGAGQVINFSIEQHRKSMQNMIDRLRKSKPPIPVTVCGQPFQFGEKWSTPAVKEILTRKGAQVVHDFLLSCSPYKQLNHFLSFDDQSYTKALLSLCRNRACQFSHIAYAPKKRKVIPLGILFKPIPGIMYDKQYVNKHALFLQYIHRAGIDNQQVYQQANNVTLYRCIDMMGRKYRGKLSSDDLLALALCNIDQKSDNSKHVIIQKITEYKDKLSGDLAKLSSDEIWEKLRPVGLALHEKYMELPRLTTSFGPP